MGVMMPSDFQASAGEQGRRFAEQCTAFLRGLGWEVGAPLRLGEVGVEIDAVGTSPGGSVVWFEYKGSVQGNRPGLRRTDTLKKAIANGALLQGLEAPKPFVVITSHLPVGGSGDAMLEAALRLGYLAEVVCLYDPATHDRLDRW
ncbi:MAG: hypothetical protein JJE46_12280 [Acidimicrobiia bacterium]|nr:hypothetical protein [Acidimicrobiia bacterium]